MSSFSDADAVDHINVVLNTDADTTGSKVVIVDDGTENALKFVTESAELFYELCALHAARIRVIKLKGNITAEIAQKIVDSLRLVITVQNSVTSGVLLREIVAKSAVFYAGSEVAIAEALHEMLPNVVTLIPAKKVELVGGSVGQMTASAVGALFTKSTSKAICAARVSRSVKAKLKLGSGIASRLLDSAALSAISRPCDAAGARVAPVDQLKCRGPLTVQATAAVSATLTALTSITTVKLARYVSLDDAAVDALATCLLTAASTRQIRLALKSKVRGKSDTQVTTNLASVQLAALLREFATAAAVKS